MTTPFEIPLSPAPQRLSISLSGVQYQLVVKWNVPATCWMLDILDEDGTPMLTSVPIVTGTDLLGQYEYLGLGAKLYAVSDGENDIPPDFTTLGVTGHLYWVTP